MNTKKLTLDEQIADMEARCRIVSCKENESILASLERLKAIDAVQVPEEPVRYGEDTNGEFGEWRNLEKPFESKCAMGLFSQSATSSMTTGLRLLMILKRKENRMDNDARPSRKGVCKMSFADKLRERINATNNALSAPAEKALNEFLTDHAAEIEALVRAAAQCAEVQEEPCRFDHNGYCQEHYLDHQLDGCRVASLHNALAALEKEKS